MIVTFTVRVTTPWRPEWVNGVSGDDDGHGLVRWTSVFLVGWSWVMVVDDNDLLTPWPFQLETTGIDKMYSRSRGRFGIVSVVVVDVRFGDFSSVCGYRD